MITQPDMIFDFTYLGQDKPIVLCCGVTFDYATDTGADACLTSAYVGDWDVKGILDKALIREIEEESMEVAAERARRANT